MLDLADIKPVIKEGKMNLSNFELVKESVNGNTYAIVREKNRYYIKSSQTKQNLNESNFDHLGGLGSKAKNSFSSYEEATRYLNLMFEEINNHYEGVDNINLLESDFINEKKFVLKLNKKKSEPKAKEPVSDFGGGEEAEGGEFDFGGGEEAEGGEFDFGGETEGGETEGDEFDFGGETEGGETEGGEFDFGGGEEAETEGGDEFDFGGETEEGDEDLDLEDSDDEIKDIQSTTGKLGQQLRDVEDLSSDMQKWVAKSVLSALNLDNMDTEDKKDIIRTIKKKTEEEPEETEETSFDFGGEEPVEETYDSYMEDEDPYLITRKDLEESDEVGYTFYMKEEPKFSENELEDWLYDMEEAGFASTPMYDSYMEDRNYKREDNPNIGGDEDLDTDKLLFDNETTHNPNYRTRRGVDSSPNNDNFVRNYNMDYDDFEMSPQREKEPDTAPSEPTTRPGTPDKTPDRERPSRRPFNPPPHITPGEEPGPKAGTKRGYMDEDYTEPMMFPAPAKEPDTAPSEPETIPGTPDKTPDRERPSRRPFNPPPHITPGEEPGPKAGYDDDVVFE